MAGSWWREPDMGVMSAPVSSGEAQGCAAQRMWRNACNTLVAPDAEEAWKQVVDASPPDSLWHTLRNCVAYQAGVWQNLLNRGMDDVIQPAAFKLAIVLRHTPSELTVRLLTELLRLHPQAQDLMSYILALLTDDEAQWCGSNYTTEEEQEESSSSSKSDSSGEDETDGDSDGSDSSNDSGDIDDADEGNEDDEGNEAEAGNEADARNEVDEGNEADASNEADARNVADENNEADVGNEADAVEPREAMAAPEPSNVPVVVEADSTEPAVPDSTIAEGATPECSAPASSASPAAAAPQRDLQLFGDCELAVLGASREEYDAHAKLVRAEYSKLTHDNYVQLRIKVLDQFTQIPKLYHTPEFEGLEAAARENIEREISTLREHLLTGRRD